MKRALLLASCLLAVSGCRGPEPFELATATAPETEQVPFTAGVAERVFTPGRGYPLGGYGGGARREEFPFAFGMGWHGRLALAAHMAWNETGDGNKSDMLVGNEGVHDDLTAHALVLRPEGRRPLALVRIDAIGMPLDVLQRVLGEVEDLGYGPENLVLAATHTHAGMGGFIRDPFGCAVAMDNFRPELEDRLVDACVEAIRAAHETARPATIGFGRAQDVGPAGKPVLAYNRRSGQFDEGVIDRGDTDNELGIMLVADAESKERIAVLVNFAIHPTVMGPDNLYYSADVTGGIERALKRRLGGTPVLFFNGAEGDIGPGKIKASGGLKRINEIGEAFAEIALPAIEQIKTHATVSIGGAYGRKEFGHAFAQIAAGRERFIDGDEGILSVLTMPLALPVNAILWTLGFTNVRFAITWNLGVGVVVYFDGLIEHTRTLLTGLRLQAGDENVALLTIPGEATHDVGESLRAKARERGATRTFVLGLAQDHLMYIASRREYRRGGYESISTLFGETTADQVVDAHTELLEAIGFANP
jgi:hypothetical protein